MVRSLTTLLQRGHVDERTLSTLRIHLDWIQYRANFRDPVSVRCAIDATGQSLPLAEVAIDLRQMDVERLTPLLADAQKALQGRLAPDAENGPIALDEFRPMRDGLIWQFNRLFWQRLADWESASGRGFEETLPSSTSDGNHPQAIADAVGDFWRCCAISRRAVTLPEEDRRAEIGVGKARPTLAGSVQALDEQCGTAYYRIRFLLGDYSPRTLDTALAAVRGTRRW